jgi:hypothetical protein
MTYPLVMVMMLGVSSTTQATMLLTIKIINMMVFLKLKFFYLVTHLCVLWFGRLMMSQAKMVIFFREKGSPSFIESDQANTVLVTSKHKFDTMSIKSNKTSK